MNRSNPALSGRSKGGADFLQLDPSEAPAGGLADWLTERLRAAISSGQLAVGTRLPATRTLAADLGISRGVVTESYQRLTEDGQVAGRGRGGTIVVAAQLADRSTVRSGLRTRARPPGVREVAGEFADTSCRPADDPEIFDALRSAPARVDLTPGVPDLAAFPRAAWLRAERAVLSDLGAAEFGYGDPAGTPALRRAVAGWLAQYRGIAADPEDLIIVAGVAQAIAIVAQLLDQHGIHEIAVEDPGSLGSRQHLQNWGMRTPPVPVDDRGMQVDVLRKSEAAVVMATPAHHFPTGVVLDGERRRELVQWATDGGLIIEDDYDAEHRYDRPPVPALRAMLPEQVIYVGSVSKLLAPALRIGWMLAPPQYKEELIGRKRLADLGNAALPQLTLAHLMESGELERQLRMLRRRHRTRRDAMVAAIRTHLPTATIHGAAAGLHLTITFDEGDDLALAAAALDAGVKCHPLSWHCQLPHAPGLVLGYAARTPTEITDAIATIASVR
ncbi:GntR family transcriptional regulator/MocR family aminotransferase [Kribbella aluminosa]|uniref:GntR family transcriptional regulator/MocR family aminotransferase n=1 Tax=Kribbella aluminosa TaxID=416017 RepID=A0ABS4US41_9ACTN|nr:PLP-dependent aminotransferase family protein [Kribbella aluminosa]MBP2354452.1 GntR family transcriptional regulator/MocR family aminotransferase [Kribbella aluminosa]